MVQPQPGSGVASTTSRPASIERVAVIGGGFIGLRVAAEAVRLGRATTVLTRNPGADGTVDGVAMVAGDAADPDAVGDLLRTPAHVVHCAGGRLPTESIDDPAGDATATLGPLLCVLEVMRQRPGSRLTLLSSGGTVYGRPEREPVDEDHPCRPVVPYGVSRLAAEQYAAIYASLHGVPVRILRLGNVYGPTQRSDRRQGLVAALLAAARSDGVAQVWGSGEVARDYVHVDDVAEVVHRLPAPAAAAEVLNVGTGTARTVDDVVDAVVRVTGRMLRVTTLPGRGYDIARIALSPRRLQGIIAFDPLQLEAGLARTWAALGETAARPLAAETM